MKYTDGIWNLCEKLQIGMMKTLPPSVSANTFCTLVALNR